MYEYEMSKLRSAELRGQAAAWRLAHEAAKAGRSEKSTEGRVVERKGGVRHALRAVRQHNAA
ncbi:hypothetical protein ACFXJ5_36840 [Streptomyces sp. NPDC059373]